MKYVLVAFLMLVSESCESKPSNEMEAIGQDVLKKNEGLEITIMPVDKTKK